MDYKDGPAGEVSPHILPKEDVEFVIPPEEWPPIITLLASDPIRGRKLRLLIERWKRDRYTFNNGGTLQDFEKVRKINMPEWARLIFATV
jgi:hypothetical protein